MFVFFVSSSVISSWVLPVLTIIFNSAFLVNYYHIIAGCPSEESSLRYSSNLVAKFRTVWVAKVELHRLF